MPRRSVSKLAVATLGVAIALCSASACSSFGESVPKDGGVTSSSNDGSGRDGSLSDQSAVANDGPFDGNPSDAPAFFLPGTYPGTVLDDKPIGYWRLDNGVGSTGDVLDFSGHNVTGTPNLVTFGAGGALAGDKDTAASFDGNGNIDLGPNFNIVGTATMSVEAWIAPTDTSKFMHVFSREADDGTGDGTEGFALYVGPADDGVGFERYHDNSNANKVKSGFVPPTGIFTHVVGTYDGMSVAIFVNGVQMASTSDSNPLNSKPDVDARIGALGASAQRFKGVIDEVAIYDKALTPERIQRHYLIGMNGPMP